MECGDLSPLFAEPKLLFARLCRVGDTMHVKPDVINMLTGNNELTEKRR